MYLVFDRYMQFSTKCPAIKARGAGDCRIYKLSANSPLPPQKQILSVTDNKKQLIQIIIETRVLPE